MVLKFYNSVVKRQAEIQIVLGVSFYVCKRYRGKIDRKLFFPLPSSVGLKFNKPCFSKRHSSQLHRKNTNYCGLFKGCSSLLSKSKGEHLRTKEKCFYFTSKALSILEVKKFNFSRNQMSYHQIHKHETRNTLYCLTWKVNTIW